MAASIAALSSAEAWEAARQAAREHVQAFEIGGVAQAWIRLIRGSSANDGAGPAYQLQGSVNS
jgi:hypothetical protein